MNQKELYVIRINRVSCDDVVITMNNNCNDFMRKDHIMLREFLQRGSMYIISLWCSTIIIALKCHILSVLKHPIVALILTVFIRKLYIMFVIFF